MVEAKSTSTLALWDFRHTVNELTAEEIIKCVSKIAKRFVFQIEKSDNGYVHFQGRMSLVKRRRRAEKHILLDLLDIKFEYLEPTANPSFYSGDMFYVMKEDTRIEGPYRDDDEVKILTSQLKLFNGFELRQYQSALLKMCTEFDMRCIDLIYDKIGNIGKSLFCEHLEYQGLAEEVPPYRLMDDIFAWVCSRPIKPCYLFDMPRGMKKDKLSDFYSGIEVIKNGVAYDKRYNAKKIRFNRPRIFVFTNTLPIFSLMSKDRWRVWEIDDKYQSKKFNCEALSDTESDRD